MPKRKDKLLSEQFYYTPESDRKYMSPSLFKALTTCEARAMAKLRGEYEYPPLPSLLIGQYVETVLLNEDVERFLAEHEEMFVTKLVENADTIAKVAETNPELVTRNLTWKPSSKNKAKELRPDAFSIERELRSEFTICGQVIERAQRDKMFMDFLQGDHQTVLTGTIDGVLWKGKTDVIDVEKGRIVDLKVMADTKRRGGISFIEAYRYDEQLAIYRLLAEKTYKKPFRCYIACVTKESPSDVVLAEVPEWRIRELEASVRDRMPHVAAVWRGEIEPEHCGMCDYCRDTKVLTHPIDFDLVGMSQSEMRSIGAA